MNHQRKIWGCVLAVSLMGLIGFVGPAHGLAPANEFSASSAEVDAADTRNQESTALSRKVGFQTAPATQPDRAQQQKRRSMITIRKGGVKDLVPAKEIANPMRKTAVGSN